MTWYAVAASVASAAYGAYSSGQAADKQAKGAQNAIAEQRRQFNISMGMLEPTRALGYGAQSDLASLYGYRLPSYTPLGALGSAGTGAGASGPITVGGRKAPGEIMGQQINPLASGSQRYGGSIDPYTGTVTIRGGKNAQMRSDAATAYLRGETDALKGKKFSRFRNEIDRLRAGGYQYDPNAATTPTAGPIAGATEPGTSADGTAGNFGRFFTSPDYQFRLGEGVKAVDQSAAARGGLFSGNTGKAVVGYGSNLAAGEYGSYVNRLLAMAGLGQTATNTGVQLGQNTANNVSNGMQNVADSRASGVMGAANSVTGALNSGMNTYMLQQYLNRMGSQTPAPSPYGPYQDGYKFPG